MKDLNSDSLENGLESSVSGIDFGVFANQINKKKTKKTTLLRIAQCFYAAVWLSLLFMLLFYCVFGWALP